MKTNEHNQDGKIKAAIETRQSLEQRIRDIKRAITDDEQEEIIADAARRLDRYFFRLGAIENAITGDETTRATEDCLPAPYPAHYTDRQKAIASLSCEISDAILELCPAAKRLISQASEVELEQVIAEGRRSFLVGLLVGLRLAGLPSDIAQRMAATWRVANLWDGQDLSDVQH